jgi:hypothetical protein
MKYQSANGFCLRDTHDAVPATWLAGISLCCDHNPDGGYRESRYFIQSIIEASVSRSCEPRTKGTNDARQDYLSFRVAHPRIELEQEGRSAVWLPYQPGIEEASKRSTAPGHFREDRPVDHVQYCFDVL